MIDFMLNYFNPFNLLLPIVLFIVGWFFGGRTEKKHLSHLAQAEQLLVGIILSNERRFVPQTTKDGVLLVGSVVIAQDYFKLTLANVVSIFGLNLKTFESLLERARREALIRLKTQAQSQGFTHIYGVRFETVSVSGGFEVVAYGTAVVL